MSPDAIRPSRLSHVTLLAVVAIGSAVVAEPADGGLRHEAGRPEIQLLGPLTAQGEELGKVVQQLQRAAGVRIQITDAALAGEVVGLHQRAPTRLGTTLRALAMQVGAELVIDTSASGETARLRIQPQAGAKGSPPKGQRPAAPASTPAKPRDPVRPEPPTAPGPDRPADRPADRSSERAYAKHPRDINMEAKYRALGGLCFSRQMKKAEAKAKEVLDLGYRGTRFECWVHDKLAGAYDGLKDRANAVRCYRLALACSDPQKGAHQRATKRLRELGVPLREAPAEKASER